MKLHLIWRGEKSFELYDEFEKARVNKRFTLDKIYEAEIKTRRNLKKHQLYWVLLDAIAFHFGGSANSWHDEFMKEYMETETRKIGGKIYILRKREAFEWCTEERFSKYFERVQRALVEQGFNPDELIKEAN